MYSDIILIFWNTLISKRFELFEQHVETNIDISLLIPFWNHIMLYNVRLFKVVNLKRVDFA